LLDEVLFKNGTALKTASRSLVGTFLNANRLENKISAHQYMAMVKSNKQKKKKMKREKNTEI
jgi:hypothetical protein